MDESGDEALPKLQGKRVRVVRLVKDETGQVRLMAMIDDEGRIIFDIPCPIKCGACCDEWRDLRAFGHFAKAVLGIQDCPNLGPRGCKLPRKKRPIECTVYLCELALLAVHEMLTDEERDRVLASRRQESAFSMLGKFPKPDVDIRAEAARIRPDDSHKIEKLRRKESR